MKKFKLTLYPLFSTVVLFADPIELNNQNGATITAEIQSVDGGRVTIERASDRQSFTFDIATLDEASRGIVRQWEMETVYFPESRPFFDLNGQTIIPLKVDGTTLTYLDPQGEQKSKSIDTAPKLEKLAQANATAQGKLPAGLVTPAEVVQNIELQDSTRQFGFADRIAYKDDPSRDIKNSPKWVINLRGDVLGQAKLWELTYDIYWANIEQITVENFRDIPSELYWSSTASRDALPGIMEAGINPKTRNQGTLNPTAGLWMREKVYIRPLRESAKNLLYFYCPNFYGDYVIKNVQLKPIPDAKEVKLYSMEDIRQYNVFASTTAFETEVKEAGVVFRSDEPLKLTLPACLDKGYAVRGTVRHSGGQLNWPEAETMADLTVKKKSVGSATETTFSFTVSGRSPHYEDILTLEAPRGQEIDITEFSITAELLPNAEKLNPFHAAKE